METLFKACVRYFSLFLKEVVFSSHSFMNIHPRLSYYALPALLKPLVLKKELHV